MTHATPMALAASLCLLTACSGSGPAGGRIDVAPLPVAAVAPCRHPADFFPAREMTQAQVEIAAGRMGDALIRCGQEKAALAAWAEGAVAALGADSRTAR